MDEVVCAFPSTDIALAAVAMEYAKVWGQTGDENDVLKRYFDAATHHRADIIMRITGDCPLISPELCREVLMKFIEEDADYGSNIEPRTFPRGFDCEVFTSNMLKMSHELARAPDDREHVTSWMRREKFMRRSHVVSPWPIEGHLCIDTQADYDVVKAYFDESRQHLRAA